MAKSKKDNEDQPANGDDSADNFGLPDIEYKPLDRDQNEPVKDEPKSRATNVSEETSDVYDDEEPSSKAPVFVTLIVLVVIAVAGFLVYKYWYVPRGEKAKQEKLAKEAEEKRLAEEARLAQEKAEAERKRLEAEAANAKPAVGTIETLTGRTSRWFVIVTSDIDDDLVMDYAKKLSSKGVSSKIIPPYGKYKFFRLGIGDFDDFTGAQSSADASKGEYGNDLWVMKY